MLRVIKIAIFLTDNDEVTPLVEVNEALTCRSLDVDPDSMKEKKRIDAFSCGCKLKHVENGTGMKGCSTQLTVAEILSIRLDWSSMPQGDLSSDFKYIFKSWFWKKKNLCH